MLVGCSSARAGARTKLCVAFLLIPSCWELNYFRFRYWGCFVGWFGWLVYVCYVLDKPPTLETPGNAGAGERRSDEEQGFYVVQTDPEKQELKKKNYVC